MFISLFVLARGTLKFLFRLKLDSQMLRGDKNSCNLWSGSQVMESKSLVLARVNFLKQAEFIITTSSIRARAIWPQLDICSARTVVNWRSRSLARSPHYVRSSTFMINQKLNVSSIHILMNVWADNRDGWKTQDGRMTTKCRVTMGMQSLARHFYVILSS